MHAHHALPLRHPAEPSHQAVCTQLLACLLAALLLVVGSEAAAELHAGAAIVDITPQQFPVFINGGFTARKGEPRDVKARALVLADGTTTLALVVADSCILPKELIDADNFRRKTNLYL